MDSTVKFNWPRYPKSENDKWFWSVFVLKILALRGKKIWESLKERCWEFEIWMRLRKKKFGGDRIYWGKVWWNKLLHLPGFTYFWCIYPDSSSFFSCLFVCNLMHIWKTWIISSGMEHIYSFLSFYFGIRINLSDSLNHVTDKTNNPKFWSMNKKTVVQQCSLLNHYHYVNEPHLKMRTKYSARILWFLPKVSVDTYWVYILT